jgi:menaquinone-dependent protoporphyrinogen oxidase
MRLVCYVLKALIAYGTRYGATGGTSEEIGKILQEKGFDVKIVNVKEEKIKDISEYDLIVVASGMRMGKWVSEAEDFLKKFHKEFEHKKLALFCSSVAAIAEKEGNTEEVAKIRKKALEDKVSKYGLKPVMTTLFGGILNYNKMGWMTRGMEVAFKSRLQNTGFKEAEPGVYDLRDWDEIRNWATELAEKAS